MADALTAAVAEAERLLAQAGYDQAVPLPMLSAAELWGLCGAEQVLADERELAWWNGTTEAQRQARTDSILGLLRIRHLVLATAPGDEAGQPTGPLARRVPLTPPLALVAAARRQPVVAAIGTLADGSAVGTPRMFGLAAAGRPVAAVVGEYIAPAPEGSASRLGPHHHFSLLSPGKAGHVLAIWAGTDTGGAGKQSTRRRAQQPRTVEVIRWRSGGPVSLDRLAVAGAREPFGVTRQRPGANPEPPVPADLAELARVLTRMLTED
jgi:hypothetical protein